jgi:shikimate dehydrogenase
LFSFILLSFITINLKNLATKHSINAQTAGAVNTIKVDGDTLIGENTDGIGLLHDLTDIPFF